MRAPFPFVLVLVLVLQAIAGPPAGPPVALAADSESPFVVERASPDKLHVAAKSANLADLLTAIGEQGDFEVVMDREIERPPVSVTIDEAKVEEVVRRVLRRRSYVLMYDAAGRLARVVVLSPPDRRTAQERQLAERQRRTKERLERLRAQVSADRAGRAGGPRNDRR